MPHFHHWSGGCWWRTIKREGAGRTFINIKIKFWKEDINAEFENTVHKQRDNVLVLPRKTRIALDDD